MRHIISFSVACLPASVFSTFSGKKVIKHEMRVFIFFLQFCLKRFLFEEELIEIVQGGSNMTGTNCDLFTHK
jgi:hypothetical protein